MDDIEKEIDALSTWEAELASFGAGRNIGVPDASRESGVSFFVEEAARMSSKTALIDEQRKVETINALMRSAGSSEGKKILLLATHRLSEYAGAEALYWLGVAHYKQAHDPAQLRPSWQRLAQEYPHSEWARRTQIPSKS